MNSRDLLIVLVRILLIAGGLYLFGMAFLSTPVVLSANSSDRSYMFALAGVVLLILVLFWVFAGQLASLLLPKSSHDNEVTSASLVQELTRSAICIIAVYYIANSLASFPMLFFFMTSGSEAFKVPGGETLSKMFIIAPISDLLIGLLLLLFASRIAKRISNKEAPTSAL